MLDRMPEKNVRMNAQKECQIDWPDRMSVKNVRIESQIECQTGMSERMLPHEMSETMTT
jgi:hypothetical protein